MLFVKNGLKKIVLGCVLEMGIATGRSVADRLGYNRVSDRKKVSLTLLKCKRQGLAVRESRKRGRVERARFLRNTPLAVSTAAY